VPYKGKLLFFDLLPARYKKIMGALFSILFFSTSPVKYINKINQQEN
jgi:hypothetical protein